jgi:hypothetical protein
MSFVYHTAGSADGPPEINFGRMYAGPGSGPMRVAAAAWDVLAAELYSTASSYGWCDTRYTPDKRRGDHPSF